MIFFSLARLGVNIIYVYSYFSRSGSSLPRVAGFRADHAGTASTELLLPPLLLRLASATAAAAVPSADTTWI